jgi:cytochrome P450
VSAKVSTDVKIPRIEADRPLSLYRMLEAQFRENPYPLYEQLRREAPVLWDPFLHAWVVTRYEDVLQVLRDFSSVRTPTPEQLNMLGLSQLSPIAEALVELMLFMDGERHARLRGLCSQAFTPARIAKLRDHIQEIADRLLDKVLPTGEMEMMDDFAAPLPSIVTAEFLGVPVTDHRKLKVWSADFAQLLGNFQGDPEGTQRAKKTLDEMIQYFKDAIRAQKDHPSDGLVHHVISAEYDGERFSEEELIPNLIATMVGGQETTMNLIGNGTLTLLRQPEVLEDLRAHPELIPSAVEELLRYESPSQHTARLAHENVELGGKLIHKRQAVMAVMGAANRDPERFPDPDRLDIRRPDNKHVAFGFGAHFCFGAPLARLEAQVAFAALLRRVKNLNLKPGPIRWRNNLGLRGLEALPLTFDAVPATN